MTHRRGFKPGGVNATSALSNVPGIKATFDPETLKDLVGGIKADWRLGGIQARTHLAVYHSWYSNIHRSEVINIPHQQGGGVTTQPNNIAAAERTGEERENNVRLDEELTVLL